MWTYAATLALAGAVGAGPPPAPPPYPDLSEPKAAAFSLAVALARGDVKVAREAYAGDDKEFLKYLDTLADVRAKADRFERALNSRLGEFAAKVFARSFDAEWHIGVGDKGNTNAPLTVLIAVAEVKADGDQATLPFDIRLKKTAAGWKVTGWPKPNPLSYVGVQIMDASFKEVTAEIEQGKYAKVYEVLAAFERARSKHAAELVKGLAPKGEGPKDGKKE